MCKLRPGTGLWAPLQLHLKRVVIRSRFPWYRLMFPYPDRLEEIGAQTVVAEQRWGWRRPIAGPGLFLKHYRRR